MTNTQRKAVIRLPPKKGDLSNLKNWRPISLLNCDMKITSAALSKRLKNTLPHIISPSQTCSIQNRQIHDHTTLICDIISYSHQHKKSLYIISVDQQKAFDKISHDFIYKALGSFDFPEKYINYIKALYKNAENAIIIDDGLTSFFRIKRGVRQGCPLSCILYVIAIEILGIYFKKDERLSGFKIPNCTKPIKYLQYADDITLFLNSLEEYNIYMEIFDDFCKASGASLNKDKTFGFYINHKDPKAPGEILPINWNTKNKILGVVCTHCQNTNKQLNWERVIENIQKKANLLSSRKLLLRGRALIANTLLLSKAWYIGSVYTRSKNYKQNQ